MLGKTLNFQSKEGLCAGIIIETEAYLGVEDAGSHSYKGKRTTRNEVMYQPGGCTYMYICYGMHQMFNVVTGPENYPHAVLIRALQPVIGLDLMYQRRGNLPEKQLCKGPGSLCKAMGLNKTHNEVDLNGNQIWIEDNGLAFADDLIRATPRIGLNIPDEYKLKPWRFIIAGNDYVSAKKS